MRRVKEFFYFLINRNTLQERSLVIIMVSMLCSIGLWIGLNIYFEYQSTLKQHYHVLEVRAKQHEARMVSLLDHIDAVLESIGSQISTADEYPIQYEHMLYQYHDQLKEVCALFITDEAGKIIASTLPDIVGFDAKEREYFKTHATQTNRMLHLSKPFKTILGSINITLSRPLMDKGIFKGSVVVLLKSDYFDEALNSKSDDKTLAVALLNQEGDILNRLPSVNYVGQNLQNTIAFKEHVRSKSITTQHLRYSTFDGVKKLCVFHSLEDYPLFIVTSDHYDAVIYRWKYSTFFNSLSFMMLVSMILFLIRLAIKQQAFVQDTMDSVSHQIAVIDGQGRITAINSAWKRFSMENSKEPGKMAPNTDVGSNYLSASEETNSVVEGIKEVLEGRSKLFTYEYPCHSPYKERWFTMSVTPLRSDKKSAVIVHSDITERKLSEMKVRNLAFYDSLTGLPNRRLLSERMVMALAASSRHELYGAVLLLDLDKFKYLNDTFGHASGDMLLAEVAKRLSLSVREVDTVARLGGDEFVVVLSGLNKAREIAQADALAIAEKIRTTLGEPYEFLLEEERSIKITYECTVSIGMVLFNSGGLNQNELIKQADKGMYQSKKEGGNRIYCIG